MKQEAGSCLKLRAKVFDELRERLAAVADPVLVFESQLRSGLAEARNKKQRIVAEAAASAGSVDDFAAPFGFTDDRLRIGFASQQYGHANIVCAAIVRAAKRLQQLRVIVVVCRGASGKPRGMYSRRSGERVNTKPGVVGERGQSAQA